jgi:hypothetical protein
MWECLKESDSLEFVPTSAPYPKLSAYELTIAADLSLFPGLLGISNEMYFVNQKLLTKAGGSWVHLKENFEIEKAISMFSLDFFLQQIP